MTAFFKLKSILPIISYEIYLFFLPKMKGPCYSKIGVLYFNLEKYYTAIVKFRQSEENNSNNSDLTMHNIHYMGYCHLNLGNYCKAIDYFEQYLKKNNDNEIIELLGWCYLMLCNYSKAIRMYEIIENSDSCLIYHKIQLVQLLIETGKKKDALKKLSKINTSNSIANDIVIGLKYKLKGDLKMAISTFDNILKNKIPEIKESKYFQMEDLYLILSDLQKENGYCHDAIITLEDSYKLNSKDVWVKNALAMEYAEQNKNLKRALKLIDQCLAHQPENPLFIDTKAWILYKSKVNHTSGN